MRNVGSSVAIKSCNEITSIGFFYDVCGNRHEKIDHDKIREQAEEFSRENKDVFLSRLLVAEEKLTRFKSPDKLIFREMSFHFGWKFMLYTEENVSFIEREARELEDLFKKEESIRVARETFKPQFEKLISRAESVDIKIRFGDNFITVIENDKYYSSVYYSDDGLAELITRIAQKELVIKVA